MKMRFLAVATLGIFGVSVGSALAEVETMNWGTLGCTLSQSERLTARPQAKASLSCKFTGINGKGAYYDGVITEIGVRTERNAKITYFWSVQGPSNASPLAAIGGRYRGRLVAAQPSAVEASEIAKAVFRGGEGRSVVLRPLAASRTRREGGVEAILTLRRSTVRSSLDHRRTARG